MAGDPAATPPFDDVPAPTSRPFATLADRLPEEARLFCELVSLDELLQSPAGQGLAEVFDALLRNVHDQSATRPSDQPWQVRVAGAVGVRSDDAARLLLDGPIALAAEGWSGLGNLILLTRPRDPAALEAALAGQRIAEDPPVRVRRYRLEGGHELACDGAYALVGVPSRLFNRTMSLWTQGGNTLATDPLYYQLTSQLPPGTQLTLFIGTPRIPGTDRSVWPAIWAENLPDLDGLSAGLLAAPRGMIVEMVGHIQPEAEAFKSMELSVERLNRLPRSTVAAWTASVDYPDLLQGGPRDNTGIRGSLASLLAGGWAPGILERRLLNHLVGQSLFIVGRRPIELERDPAPAPASLPATSSAPATAPAEQPTLWLPTIALAVETDDPHAVETAVQQLAVNLLLQLAPERDPRIIPEPLPGGGELQRLEFTAPLPGGGDDELFSSLSISWAVADRWLIMATDSGWLGEIVAGWRGLSAEIPAPGLHEHVRQVQAGGGAAMTVVTVRPRQAAEMTDSWLAYLERRHPDLLSGSWWDALRRRHAGERVQLGFLASRGDGEGLLVEETLEGTPARNRLMPGDRIVAVDGAPLDHESPADSLRRLLDQREQPDRVILDVRRAGEPLRIELPLARDDVRPFQPGELLRRLSRLCANVTTARFAGWRPSRNLLHARLEVQFAQP